MGLNVFSLQRILADQDPMWCVREVERVENQVLIDVETAYPLDFDVTVKLENALRNGNGSRLRLCIRYFVVDRLGRRCYEPLMQGAL